MNLKENERIDDLGCKNLKIIQNEKGFCFGIDSVLLTDFAKDIKRNSKVLDLGTGTGIIPILLSGKTEYKEAVGVEVQEQVANMAKRSVKLNGLDDKIEIVCENILNLESKYTKNYFDVIITNPPYKKKSTGLTNIDERKLVSRHEIMAELQDFIKIANLLLKDKGEFYMVHRTERLVDIMSLMRKYHIEPKIMKLVYSYIDKPPKLVLIKGIKNSKSFLKVEKNLYIYNKDGNYTDDIKKIYRK